MSNRTKFYINGEWVAPSTSDTIDVINPATEQPIGQVAMGGAADVDKAVAAAKAAFETFSQTTREERISLLKPSSQSTASAWAMWRRSVKKWARR